MPQTLLAPITAPIGAESKGLGLSNLVRETPDVVRSVR